MYTKRVIATLLVIGGFLVLTLFSPLFLPLAQESQVSTIQPRLISDGATGEIVLTDFQKHSTVTYTQNGSDLQGDTSEIQEHNYRYEVKFDGDSNELLYSNAGMYDVTVDPQETPYILTEEYRRYTVNSNQGILYRNQTYFVGENRLAGEHNTNTDSFVDGYTCTTNSNSTRYSTEQVNSGLTEHIHSLYDFEYLKLLDKRTKMNRSEIGKSVSYSVNESVHISKLNSSTSVIYIEESNGKIVVNERGQIEWIDISVSGKTIDTVSSVIINPLEIRQFSFEMRVYTNTYDVTVSEPSWTQEARNCSK